MQEPDPCSRRIYAGHHLANKQAPARLITGQRNGPAFDVIYHVSTRHPRFTFVRLHRVIPDALKGTPSPATLTATALDRSSSRVVCGLLLQGDHGGPPDKQPPGSSISHTTRHREHTGHLFDPRLFPRSWRTFFPCLPCLPLPAFLACFAFFDFAHPVTLIFVDSLIFEPFCATNSVGIFSLL